jgi:asparagine N-glycosylation enzyme membrane subunit Stt3
MLGVIAEFPGRKMDQTVLFFLFLLAMLAAWLGPRPLAAVLFGVALVLTVADFFHHATSALTLSF